jgi:hypothetical protein
VRGPAHRSLIGALACAGSLLVASGCGGSANSSSVASSKPVHPVITSATGTAGATTTTSASSAGIAAWAAQTQKLCIAKRAAIARLGDVHITYAGIARVGLPAVKRSLDRYLGKLLAVLSGFERRQQLIATPPSLRPVMSQAAAIDAQSQNATRRVRADVASSNTAAELSAGFNSWLATLQRLSARGDAVARQLGLSACRSGANTTQP